jgi:hypothetical protein
MALALGHSQRPDDAANQAHPLLGDATPPAVTALAESRATQAVAKTGGAPGSSSDAPVILPVRSNIQVDAREETLESGISAPYHVTGSEVLSSAGTWGDFTRYLQMLPGIVWNTDMSNDVMVRGGNPTENLYVVDGIEVPNINHIAFEGTTGGFTSMIDTSTIGSVDVKAGVYDPHYSSRMSSLIDVHTRENEVGARAGELSLGISGVGGFVDEPFGGNADLLLSAHRSVLNLVTNDIGVNGVPIYTDWMARLQWKPGKNDRIAALSLSGADSILIQPAPCDRDVTISDLTRYGGQRTTEGLVWQHTKGPAFLSTLTVSYSEQGQNVGQQQQATTNDGLPECATDPQNNTTVYEEHTRIDNPSLGYEAQIDRGSWLFSMGATARLAHMNYAVAQPEGELSPFNVSPNWTDAHTFARNFLSGQSGEYLQTAGTLGSRWTIVAGAREETFALTGAHMFEPRTSVAFRINGRQTVNATYGRSAQLAPAINILSFAQNQSLLPLRSQQFTFGSQLWRTSRATLSMDAYRKTYADEPVSIEYPGLMLANMVDTLGQQFVWLPLKSSGRGRSEGVELLLRAHWASRLQFLGSAAYSRTLYAAGDGIMRPGNFDFPMVANAMMTARLKWGIQVSLRDTYASGRPYTPFNIVLSEQQMRGIYDLAHVNAMRGPAYNRVDTDFNRSFRLGAGKLAIYGGVENALNRANFLGYSWLDNCSPRQRNCAENVVPGVPETEQTQMPIFPSAGMRWDF